MAEKKIETTEKQEEMVKIMLPLKNEDDDEVFVGLNGQTWKIKRGEEVEVPVGVYQILKHSEKMDTLAYHRRKALADQ